MSGALLLCAAALSGPFVLAAAVVGLSLYLILPDASWSAAAVALPVALCVPFAAAIAGRLSSSFAEGEIGDAFERGAFVLGLALWLGSDLSTSTVAAIAEIASGTDLGRASALLVASMSAAFFTAGTVALALMGCCLAVEIPGAWASEALGLRIAAFLPALRPLLLLLFASMGANLIAALFLDELSPLSISSHWMLG